jgi:hypothetical protein
VGHCRDGRDLFVERYYSVRNYATARISRCGIATDQVAWWLAAALIFVVRRAIVLVLLVCRGRADFLVRPADLLIFVVWPVAAPVFLAVPWPRWFS